jgi:N6-L-threonylcarbamoyladenine synthase
MVTLGIETSCDETSAALVETVWEPGDGPAASPGPWRFEVLSNVVSSQANLHAAYGGVVPELAARSHVERLPRVVDAALSEAGIGLDGLDLVAVTRGPGLVGALLAGVGFAKGLALDRGLPLVGVSHLDGHIHSAFLESAEAALPMLTLVVSGGHTELVVLAEDGSHRVLGRTLDDAAGEAFDKVARLLGLGYPGGPEVDRLAAQVDAREAAREFPLPEIRVDGLDFSFSGIKTSVRYALERRLGVAQGAGLDHEQSAGLEAELVVAACASFQARVVEHLVDRVRAAVAVARPATVAIAGGVACNWALRAAVEAALPGGPRVVVPAAELCTDNAAMIAAAGSLLWRGGKGRSLEVDPGLRLAS